MEHKIILGGEVYLPFARSRIKALRATGLEYASQSFEIDGVSVKVRIMPGHEYIYLSGGATIAMDSGVVDIRSISFQNTDSAFGYAIPFNIYFPGTLYLTEHVKQYMAAFTDGGFPKGYTHRGTGVQYAGTLEIKSSGVKGYVLKDNGAPAASFTPGTIKDEVTGNEIKNPRDANLASKKYGARWCPPSMFTGKCRMYVQALMGSPLYGKNNKTKVRLHPRSIIEAYKIGPQNLTIPTADGKSFVTIDTSTGVYLDRTTNKHWLFVVRATQITVYPLAPSNAGQAALRILKRLPVKTVDYDHLEAYILSESYPVFAERQVIDVTPGLAMYGCGYGWHWAWSSATADIVENLQYAQDDIQVNSAMESTHFRINFTSTYQVKDGVTTTTWEINRTTVSGPTKWAAHFQLWCIAVPIFGTNFLEKILPKRSILFDCEGPFYVFYKRDEICVCTFKGSAKADKLIRFGPTRDWVDKWVLGTQTAGDSSTYEGELRSGSFKVGSLFTTPVLRAQFNHTFTDLLKAGSEVGFVQGFDGAAASITVNIGYPTNADQPGYSLPGVQIWETVVASVPDNGEGYKYSSRRIRTYTYTRSQETQSFATQNVAAIPFFDAEAIYVYSDSQTTNQILDKSVTTSETSYMSSITQIGHAGAIFEYFTPWQMPPGGTSVITPPSTITTPGSVVCNLVCSSGVAPAKFGASLLREFSDPHVDAVSATLATTSGINTSTPLMIAPDILIDSLGVSNTTDEFPIIVGYA